MNGIYIDYKPFLLYSDITVIEGTEVMCHSAPSNIDELVNYVVDLANQHNIYNINIKAPSQFSQEVRERLCNIALYGENKFTVEEM